MAAASADRPAPPGPLRRASGYAIALASVGAALAVRTCVAPLVGGRGVYTLFILAVALTARYGGFGPALFATGLAALITQWYFVPPEGSLGFETYGDVILLCSFLISSVFISLSFRKLSQARDRLKQEAEERRRAQESLVQLNAVLEHRIGERVAELKKQATFLAHAERIAKLGSWEWEIESDRVTWSDEVFRIFGFAPGSLQPTYEWIRERILPEDRPLVREAIDQARNGGESLEFTHRLARPDGAVRTVRLRGQMVRGPGGSVVRMHGTAQDVTEEKEIEERNRRLALMESEQRARARTAELEAVMETVPAAVLVTQDAEGRKIIGNAVSYEILGMSPGRNISKSAIEEKVPYEVYVEGRPASPEELPIQKAAATGKPVLGRELEIRRPGNGSRWLFGNALPILDDQGKVLKVVAAFVEVTDRKRAEEDIRKLNAELEATVERRTRELRETVGELESFAYTVAHDLRAPLRAMKGFADLVLVDAAGRLEPQERDYLRRIGAASEQMDALVRNLLTYSRLSRADLPVEPIRLESLIDDILKELAAELRERRVEVQVEPGIPDVLGHGLGLRQAIINLLSNSMKFVAPEGPPCIRISAQTRDGWVRLAVKDNGIGIAPEHYEKLFKVFERLHAREKYPGTGVGLAIVRRTIERMGGRVGVESQPGIGSRFWIELPEAARSGETRRSAGPVRSDQSLL